MCVVSTTMVHFSLRKVFETYQVYYTIWLVHKASITIFSDGLLTSLFLEKFSVVINYTMWSSNLFFCIQLFPKFFMSQVFQGWSFSGTGSIVQVLEVNDAKQLCKNNTSTEISLLQGCSPVNTLDIFRTVSLKITSRGLLLNIVTNKRDGR